MSALATIALDVLVALVRRVLAAAFPGEPDALALIADPHARAFATDLCAEFGAHLHVKDVPVMRVVAAVFDVARACGASVPGGDVFLSRFATTIGTEICVPEAMLRGDGPALEDLLAHEAEHVAGFRADPVGFVDRYSVSEGRARIEADAAGACAAARYARTGQVPDAADVLPDLVAAYGCTAADAALALDVYRSHAYALAYGTPQTTAGAWALARLRAHP